jgi:hypothetical protein
MTNQMDREDYFNLPGFSGIYLEDSYVLDIVQSSDALVFKMEFVLREEHELYSPPKAGEQYCYKRGRLVFPNARNITWLRRTMNPIKDATGSIDYGNIDSFYVSEGRYHLEGEWGAVVVESSPPEVKFDTD